MAAGFRRQDEHGDRDGRSDPCPVQALRKDRIQKLVGGRGHYLNSQAELGRGVLNLLRGSILDSVLTSDARSATLKLVPSSAS